MLKGKHVVLKVGLYAKRLGHITITAGNSHTILIYLAFHIKGTENCLGHHRISNHTVVTFKIGELLQ